MFLYEKELSRILEEKTHELLHVLEEKAGCLLRELSGVDKVTLTKLRSIMDDYYNAENQLSEYVQKYKHDLTVAQGTISHEFEKMKSDIETETAKAETAFTADLAKIRSDFEKQMITYCESYLMEDYTREVIKRIAEESHPFEVVQKTGNSKTQVMSQNATSEALKDNYKIGVRLTEGTDLDTLTESGVYYCDAFAIGNTLLNCPDSNAFKMEVNSLFNSNRPQQIIYGTLSGNIYRRTMGSDGWRDWKRFATYEELTEAITTTSTELTEAIKDNRKIGVRLTEGTDLDTLTEAGVYYCDAFAIGKTLLNCPDSNAFKMEVNSLFNSNRPQQIIYGTLSGNIYRRTMGSDGWRDWKRFATYEELTEAITTTSTELTEAIKDNRKIGVRLTEGTDLDTLTEAGVYYCDAFAIGKTLLNCPDSNAFKMEVNTLFNSKRPQQIIYGTLSGNIYRRTMGSAGWNKWAEITSKDISLDHASRKALAIINKVKQTFTPATTIPASYLGSQDELFFYEGQSYEGIPYSSVHNNERDCFYNFTPETLFSMFKNPDSKMYGYENERQSAKTYTGAVCSSYVSWFINSDICYTTYDFKNLMETKNFVDIEDLEIGDIIWESGHVSVVSGFKSTHDGEITVIVSEMVTPVFRTKEYSRSAFLKYLKEHNASIGRLPEQGLPRTMREIIVVDDCISECGDNTFFALGTDMWMMINGETLSVLPPDNDTWVTVDKTSLPTKIGNTTQYNLSSIINAVGIWKFKTELSNGKESKLAIYEPPTVHLSDETVTVSVAEGCKIHSYDVLYVYLSDDGKYHNMKMVCEPTVTPQYKAVVKDNVFTINASKIKERYAGYFVRVYFDTGCGKTHVDSNVVMCN